ncbi:Hypothetical predicted protein [Lecanosticta acicola]|uniref:Uncharacterized protein n=1 Tax=Lecanosticta acicola TaxID=111012 RepID=A0AAI9E7V4_9PEZI|nr:Hypothetical predicted protein [Lecanosticta acicola]
MAESLQQQVFDLMAAFEQTSTTLRNHEGFAWGIFDRLSALGNVQDAAERFRLWKGNFEAAHGGFDTGSLAQHLGNTVAIYHRIEEILHELKALLESIRSPQQISFADSRGSSIGCPDDNDDDNDQLLLELKSLAPTREAHADWTLLSMRDIVTRLWKVTRMMKKTVTPDIYDRAQAVQDGKIDNQYDIQHVRERFKDGQAEDWLIVRLGSAITNRRQFLKYCEGRREWQPLSTAPKETVACYPRATISHGSVDKVATTISWSPNRVGSTSSADLTGLSRVQDGSDDTLSQSTLAPSLPESEDSTALREPTLSDVNAYLQDRFSCPYCHKWKTCKSDLEWK